ncbi:unnamed protein product [Cladocopium goreaui]|uniref:Uncharacterized protein n=1 Tax=Cladocopium goreaui TaxID=2562237 RepID=A0A9P1GBU4_9DINO|nr:unnamed protein product [Cladocopium goreaui]
MGEIFVNKLYTLHFVFTWILAVVVAVNWCYCFKLALPQYSESLLPWSIYTAFVTLLMPVVKMGLLYMEKQHERWGKNVKICQALLITMTGMVVGTSWSGWVSLLFPYVSDFSSPGPTGITLALLVTAVFIVIQAALEKFLENKQDDSTWYVISYEILLNSLWSSLGYFWNSVWNRFLMKLQRRDRKPGRKPGPKATGAAAMRQLTGAQRTGPEHKFQTIQDKMNGRPNQVDDNGPGYRPLLIKAAITLSVCLVLLYLLPEARERPESGASRGWHRRRFWIAAKMMLIIIPSYAVTDAGFYFGTQFVGTKTGSEQLGLLVAFGYAVLMTILILRFAKYLQWKPQSIYAGRLLTLGTWLVCYAWWYPWQELLYQIQGYGLWELNLSSSMECFFQVLITLAGALCFTLLVGFSIAQLTAWQCVLGTQDVDEALLEDVTSRDEQLRNFANRLGLQPATAAPCLELTPGHSGAGLDVEG